MHTILVDLVLLVGCLLAACAIAAMCGVGLVVWLAGGRGLQAK